MHTRKSKTVLGISLIVFGAVFLLDNIYYLNLIDLLFSIPALLLFIGLLLLYNQGNRLLATVFIITGGSTLVGEIFGYSFGDFFSDIWPLFLIGLGTYIILRRNENKHLNSGTIHGHRVVYSEIHKDKFELFSFFMNLRRKIISENFFQGQIVSIFGGSIVDFSDSELSESGGVLEVVSIFGHNVLRLPSHWNVIDKSVEVFGGKNDKRTYMKSESKGKGVLIIKGAAIFGSITLMN